MPLPNRLTGTTLDYLSIALDARRLTRGAPELLAARQRERLNDLVTFARANSRFYARKYHGLPKTISDIRQLPPVTKVELMEHFDDVVTDPTVRKSGVQTHIADLANLGRPYLGKYMVWTTSGTTGTPGDFLEDHNWDAVISASPTAHAPSASNSSRSHCQLAKSCSA